MQPPKLMGHLVVDVWFQSQWSNMFKKYNNCNLGVDHEQQIEVPGHEGPTKINVRAVDSRKEGHLEIDTRIAWAA